MNTQKPTSASIAIDEQAEMEDFIYNVSILTFGMGHKVVEPLIKKKVVARTYLIKKYSV